MLNIQNYRDEINTYYLSFSVNLLTSNNIHAFGISALSVEFLIVCWLIHYVCFSSSFYRYQKSK